ncbi:MAG: amidohydrolase [Pseudoxanthomonas sp.]
MSFRKSRMTMALCAALMPGIAAAQIVDSSMSARIEKDYPALEALYKDLHAHPEIGFQEVRTAGVLAAKMRELGFTVTEKVGGTGIVALYKHGEGPTVLVRTEMDGLPMAEKTNLAYASRYTQVVDGKETPTMHSCGHDMHMAWWVGTAQALLAAKDTWQGTLMFIGQPAEEQVGGAKAMLADNLFERFGKPDVGFAAHVSNLPLGQVLIKAGTTSAASDSLSIMFHGKGGHGSMPSATIDPVVMGARFVSDVQTVISREKDAAAFGVVTVGSFQAGTVANIIPDEALLKINLRSHSPEVRELLLAGVKRTAKATADMAKAPEPTITYLEGASALVNDPALARHQADVLKPVLGDKLVFVPASVPPASASEDYSEFIEAGVPSVFFGIGGYDPEVIADFKARGAALPVNHSPLFAPDPAGSIRTGVTVLTLAVIDAMKNGGKVPPAQQADRVQAN